MGKSSRGSPEGLRGSYWLLGKGGDNFFNGVFIARYPCSCKQSQQNSLSTRKTEGRVTGKRRESLRGDDEVTGVNKTQVHNTYV